MWIVHPYVSVVYDIMIYWAVFVEKPQIIPIQVCAHFITSAQWLMINHAYIITFIGHFY